MIRTQTQEGYTYITSRYSNLFPPTLSLSDFEIGQDIGNGTFATVSTSFLQFFVLLLFFETLYQVCITTLKSTGDRFALKMISKLRAHKKLSAIQTEQSIMTRLDHSNIIKLYAAFESISDLCMSILFLDMLRFSDFLLELGVDNLSSLYGERSLVRSNSFCFLYSLNRFIF